MRVGVCTLLLAGVVAAPGVWWAFGISLHNDYAVSWPQNGVVFELDVDGSSDINDGSDIAAINRSVSSWNTITCSAVQFSQTGTTASTDTLLTTNRTDGVNRIVWVEDSRWQWGQYVLGVTAPVFDSRGVIGEADIAFNGYQTSWSTNAAAYTTDVESVAVHELGHFIGIQHVLNGEWAPDPPTMSPSVDPQLRTRSLSPDDQSAACFLYPSGGYSCGGDCDCPMVVDVDSGGDEYNVGRIGCSAGSCTGALSTTTTAKPLGAVCSKTEECSSSLFCQSVGGAGSYCSRLCDPGIGDCPTGFDCYPYQSSADGACLPANLGTGGSGETCLAGVGTGSSGSGGGGSGCACDVSLACDPGCAHCDPACGDNNGGGSIPGGGGSGGGAVAGNASFFRDPCPCDTTTACDDDCSCDPECGQGCAALPPRPLASDGFVPFGGLAVALMLARLVFRRKNG